MGAQISVLRQMAATLLNFDKRVARLETLEATGNGGGAGDLFLIETIIIPAGPGGPIQFDTIPANAKHLFYTGFLNGNGSNMGCIINAGATATDLSNLMNATCGFGGGGTTFGNVRMGMSFSSSGVGAPTDVASGLWGFIANCNAASSQHLSTCAWSGAFVRDDFSHELHFGRGGGNWDRNAPITQINFFHDGAGGNTWFEPSTISLYGLTG